MLAPALVQGARTEMGLWRCAYSSAAGMQLIQRPASALTGRVLRRADVCQLPGVAAEEELAERALPVHQVLHGQAVPPVLGGARNRACAGALPQAVAPSIEGLVAQPFMNSMMCESRVWEKP